MPRRHTVDAQEADPPISYNINVRSARVNRRVVERPRQVHWEVSFDDRARDRQHLARVQGIVAERELEDLWRDCATDTSARDTKGVRGENTTKMTVNQEDVRSHACRLRARTKRELPVAAAVITDPSVDRIRNWKDLEVSR